MPFQDSARQKYNALGTVDGAELLGVHVRHVIDLRERIRQGQSQYDYQSRAPI